MPNIASRLLQSILLGFFIFLFLPVAAFSQGQKILQEDYNFLVADGEINRFRQVADTLYELNCYIDRACQPEI